MRTQVNISMDHRLKQMYEDLKEIHGKSWNEWFEEATIEFLMKIDPIQTLEYVIKQEEEKQEERKIALIRAKANIKVMDIPKIDHELAKKREELFEQESSWLAKQIMRGDPNWNRIFYKYEFENKKEALAWFRPRIERLKKG